jgi:hypothetical protein
LKYPKEFTTFYIFVIVTLSLTIILYLLTSAGVTSGSISILADIAFYFFPTILMVLCYALLYQHLELMMAASKLESSTTYADRFRVHKCAKIVKILVFILICTFVVF